MPPFISLIAAVAENGVIGASGSLPWRLSTDMKRFRRLTTGKPVVMGRATYASLGRPLPDRDNIVLTSHPLEDQGVTVVRSLDEALAAGRRSAQRLGSDEIMVIGGGVLYAAAIERADRLYITHVRSAPQGDTVFPQISEDEWSAGPAEHIPAGERDSHASEFVIYQRAPSILGAAEG